VRILLPVDGSECSTRATRKLIETMAFFRTRPRVDVLAVHLPVPGKASTSVVVSSETLRGYYNEECEAMLASSRKALDHAGIEYEAHHHVGAIADGIIAHAKKLGSTMLCMGTSGMTASASAVLGSTATKVVQSVRIPILLVP
jgi:nucleotide-binding universal stress UspA family protein